jgi:class 3 adenylate cyclase
MPELPTGTVTFLFTDLEASTRLWEERPEAMRVALARHDEILREAVQGYGVVVAKSTGHGLGSLVWGVGRFFEGRLDKSARCVPMRTAPWSAGCGKRLVARLSCALARMMVRCRWLRMLAGEPACGCP